MKFYSTRSKKIRVTFKDALLRGQAEDGGLYMPEKLPEFNKADLLKLSKLNYQELAFELTRSLLAEELNDASIEKIIKRAYDFSPKLHQINNHIYCLELFHGPTLSFKDFGAQFMAQSMCHFNKENNRKLTILVATSGDTGSAVAHAYHRVEGIDVFLLYPGGKVSPLQEKQFTTLGDNITALKVNGTFDDCQALVKQAFSDKDLRQKKRLTSANSINIGRLIPQSFYYFWSGLFLIGRGYKEMLVCVPSGNFGNMTAGLFAGKMGLPVQQYIAAVNNNVVIPEYLETGKYRARPSIQTLSNAMDVGNPSNWERIRTLYDDDHNTIQKKLCSFSVSDDLTLESIKYNYSRYHYIIDPHTAVGFEAVRRYLKQNPEAIDLPFISLSTAHPGKFLEIVQEALNINITLPAHLAALLEAKPVKTDMSTSFSEFKEFIWEHA
ncbi:threonine synthase [candidate division KSB1 bacterium]|nr:threonine synthase [candidate division KSB1 bacterium]